MIGYKKYQCGPTLNRGLVERLIEKFDKFDVYLCYSPPFWNKSVEKQTIRICEAPRIEGDSFLFGNSSLGMFDNLASCNILYVGKNGFVIQIPTGYDGGEAFYVFQTAQEKEYIVA